MSMPGTCKTISPHVCVWFVTVQCKYRFSVLCQWIGWSLTLSFVRPIANVSPVKNKFKCKLLDAIIDLHTTYMAIFMIMADIFYDSIHDSVLDSVLNSVNDSFHDSVHDNIHDSVHDSIHDSVYNRVCDSVDNFNGSVHNSVKDGVHDSVQENVQTVSRQCS